MSIAAIPEHRCTCGRLIDSRFDKGLFKMPYRCAACRDELDYEREQLREVARRENAEQRERINEAGRPL